MIPRFTPLYKTSNSIVNGITISISIINSNKSIYFIVHNTQWFCTNQCTVGNVINENI